MANNSATMENFPGTVYPHDDAQCMDYRQASLEDMNSNKEIKNGFGVVKR
jgi:hypothetical protein